MSDQIELYQVPINHETPRFIRDAYTSCLIGVQPDDIEFQRLVKGRYYKKTAVINVSDGTDMEKINQTFGISNESVLGKIVVHHPFCRSASVGDIFAVVGGVGLLVPGELEQRDSREFFLVQDIGFVNVSDFASAYLS